MRVALALLLCACGTTRPSVDTAPQVREALRSACFTEHRAEDCDRLADHAHDRAASEPGARALACEAQSHGCELGGNSSCDPLAERCGLAPAAGKLRVEQLLTDGCKARRRAACKGLESAYQWGELKDLATPEKSRALGELLCGVQEGARCDEVMRWASGDLPKVEALARAHACAKVSGLACDIAAARKLIDVFGYIGTPAGEAVCRHAFSLVEPACGRGEAAACEFVGRQLTDGPAVLREPVRLRAFREARCAASDAERCVELADELIKSERPGDVERAVSLLLSSCKTQWCLMGAGHTLTQRKRELEARPLFERGCALGSESDCYYWGKTHRLLPRAEQRRLVQDLEGSCQGAPACRERLGHYWAGAGDDKLSAAQFRAACDADDQPACVHVAGRLLDGQGAQAGRGVELLATACERRVGEACFLLARLHASGKVVPEDLAKADGLVEKACALEYTLACPKPARGTRTPREVVLDIGRAAKEAVSPLGVPVKAVGATVMSPFCLLGTRHPFCPLSW